MSLSSHRGPLGLKEPPPERDTARSLAYMGIIKEMPCIVCNAPGPSDAHHAICGRYGQTKSSDFHTLPLCKLHHQGAEGIHRGKKTWVSQWGQDYDLLPEVARRLRQDEGWRERAEALGIDLEKPWETR